MFRLFLSWGLFTYCTFLAGRRVEFFFKDKNHNAVRSTVVILLTGGGKIIEKYCSHSSASCIQCTIMYDITINAY